MDETIRDTYEMDIHDGEILAHAEIAHREKSIELRELAEDITGVPGLRPWQLEKAKWHDKTGAKQDSDRARKALDEGDMKTVDKLTKPGRKPDKPNLDKLPQEHRPSIA